MLVTELPLRRILRNIAQIRRYPKAEDPGFCYSFRCNAEITLMSHHELASFHDATQYTSHVQSLQFLVPLPAS